MDWKKIVNILLPKPVGRPNVEKIHELKVELGAAGFVALQVNVDFTKAEKHEREFVSGLIGTMQDFNVKKAK